MCLQHLMISVGATDVFQTLVKNQFWFLTCRWRTRKEGT